MYSVVYNTLAPIYSAASVFTSRDGSFARLPSIYSPSVVSHKHFGRNSFWRPPPPPPSATYHAGGKQRKALDRVQMRTSRARQRPPCRRGKTSLESVEIGAWHDVCGGPVGRRHHFDEVVAVRDQVERPRSGDGRKGEVCGLRHGFWF